MKLAIILSRFPYPLEKGDKLRAYHQIKDLSAHFDIYLYCIVGKHPEKEQLEHLDPYCKKIKTYKISPTLQKMKGAMALLGSQPIQVKMFYSYTIKRKIRRDIIDSGIDHIYCQLIRTSDYVKDLHEIPKTIDFMDALSTGMMRISNESKGLMKKVYQTEARRLTRYEHLIFDYFDNHTIISEQDRDLIYHKDRRDIHIIPNGVDTEQLTISEREKNYDILFHGNMSYPPNIASAEYIVKEILPLTASGDIRLKTLLSGASPHTRVTALASEHVTVSGWLDDVRESFYHSKIFVAPMLINTGMQNKILEAMALGIPVITTDIANNAIGGKPETDILIANTPEAFAKQIHLLLNDKTLRTQIITNARHLVEEKYSWQSHIKKLQNVLSAKS